MFPGKRSRSLDFKFDLDSENTSTILDTDSITTIKSLNAMEPSSFVSSYPIIPIPTEEWNEMHIQSCTKHIHKSIETVQSFLKDYHEFLKQLQRTAENLLNQMTQLNIQRYSFRNRGLDENRSMFFLIHKHHSLKIKVNSLNILDLRTKCSLFTEMHKFLLIPMDYAHNFISINLRHFIESIPNNSKKIELINREITMIEPKLVVPKFLPPPEDLVDQLTYPTSSTVSYFNDLEKTGGKNTSFSLLIDQFKQLTDDPNELFIVLDIAFSYAWRQIDYPFLDQSIVKQLPTFQNVRVSLFLAPHMPDEYQKLHIGQLIDTNWPYKPVVDHLMSFYFLINPLQMAKILFDAISIAGPCIDKVVDKPIEVDFDTIFPLILICVLATGIINEPQILYYVAKVGQDYQDDSIVQLGSSYAEAIITHLSGLNENELIEETKKLEQNDIHQ